MAVSRKMFDAVMKISRANPGVRVSVAHSNSYEILMFHTKRQKFWKIEHDGQIRRLEKLP